MGTENAALKRGPCGPDADHPPLLAQVLQMGQTDPQVGLPEARGDRGEGSGALAVGLPPTPESSVSGYTQRSPLEGDWLGSGCWQRCFSLAWPLNPGSVVL